MLRAVLIAGFAVGVAAWGVSWALGRWSPRLSSRLGLVATVLIRTGAGIVLALSAVAAAEHGGAWILLAILFAALALWSFFVVALVAAAQIRGDVNEAE